MLLSFLGGRYPRVAVFVAETEVCTVCGVGASREPYQRPGRGEQRRGNYHRLCPSGSGKAFGETIPES